MSSFAYDLPTLYFSLPNAIAGTADTPTADVASVTVFISPFLISCIHTTTGTYVEGKSVNPYVVSTYVPNMAHDE